MGDVMILAKSFGQVIIGLLRSAFSHIDEIVYWLLVKVYDLVADISKINIFGSTDIGDFGRRIYTIIGVIVLFKLAFSVITYILDPDKLSDSKTGFASIIRNVVIMFVMIIAVPLVFRYAMALQYLILEDDTIGRLITGHYSSNTSSVGDRMASALLAGFIRPNDEISKLEVCKDVMGESSENYQKCVDALNDAVSGSNLGDMFADGLTKDKGYKKLTELARTNDVDGSGQFYITYNFGLSTLVGGFVAYILLMFCIEIAVRTVKLAFLQLIAPIPIVTYIDNNGQGVFKKWTKACTNTYLSLFVRLAGIDFAIYIITEFLLGKDLQICSWSFSNNQLTQSNCNPPGAFAIIFLILGTLMFAKQLPKLIEEILGIKLDGAFNLNPVKALQQVPLVGGAAAAGLALGGRTALNVGRAFGTGVGNIGKLAGGAIAKSPFGTAVGSGVSAISRWAPIRGIRTAGGAIGSASRWIDNATGNNFSRIGADFEGTVGAGFTKKHDDKLLANYKRVTDAVGNMENRAKEKIKNGEAGRLSVKYNADSSLIQSLQQMDVKARAAYANSNYDFKTWYRSAKPGENSFEHYIAQKQIDFNKWYNETATYDYIDNNANEFKDATLTGFQNDYNQAINVGGFERKASAKEMHGQLGEFKGKTNDINRKRMAQQEATSKK